MKNTLLKHKPLIWIEDYPKAENLDGNNSIQLLFELGYHQFDFHLDANFLMIPNI